jgi:hypothetical protein
MTFPFAKEDDESRSWVDGVPGRVVSVCASLDPSLPFDPPTSRLCQCVIPIVSL